MIKNSQKCGLTRGILNHHINGIVTWQDDVLDLVDITMDINLTYYAIALLVCVTLWLKKRAS